MDRTDYVIRTMTRDEIDIAVEWAALEGWNPGLYDADAFYAADPNGFLIGLLNGEPVATLSAVKYGDTFGFIGFYIVKPGFRGKGLGIKIWNAGIEYLHGRNIGLDGVVEQQENYKKSGFRLAYSNIRYQGISKAKTVDHSDVVKLSSNDFYKIETYDTYFFPAQRSNFLKAWINQKDNTIMGTIQGGNLSGYGMIRPCRTGFKIGPLFADTHEIADSIFLALNDSVPPGEPVFLDTPETNQAAIDLAKNHGMKMVFGTARMYTKDFPDLPVKRLFGVTSFELG